MLPHPEQYFRQEARFAMPGLTAILGCWQWDGPFETMFSSARLHRICLHLTARPRKNSGRYSLDSRHGDYGEVGELTFAIAGSQMHLQCDGTSQRVVYCEIDPAEFGPAGELLANATEAFGKRELSACLDLRLNRSKQRMLQLAREAATPGYASELLIESLTISTFIDVVRHLLGHEAPAVESGKTLTLRQMKRVDEMINAPPGRAPSIVDFADAFGMSRGHFMRLFKATTGRGVHAYRAGLRMDQAKALLLETRLPLKVIAHHAGFSTQSSFSYAFSTAIGISPRSFRKQFQGARLPY